MCCCECAEAERWCRMSNGEAERGCLARHPCAGLPLLKQSCSRPVLLAQCGRAQRAAARHGRGATLGRRAAVHAVMQPERLRA